MRRLASLALVVAAFAGAAAAQSLVITNETLPTVIIGQPYPAVTLTTSGDPGPIVWNTDGMPFGFAVGGVPIGQPATTGIFCYGTPNSNPNNPNGPPNCSSGPVQNVVPGVYSFYIGASSLSTQQSTAVRYTLAVVAPLQILTSPPPPLAAANQFYTTQIQTSGGTGQFRWSLTAGALPPGMGLDSVSGVISGVAPGVNGAYTFTLQVLDQVTQFSASQTFTINVVGGLAITTTSLPEATVGQPYSFQLDAQGAPVQVWSVAPGWQLPSGFNLSSSGLLSGTGLSPGQTEVVIQVTNPQAGAASSIVVERVRPQATSGLTASRSFVLRVTLGPLGIKETTLPTATQNVPYQLPLTPQGGIPPYTWSFDIPNQQGMSIGANTGIISGTPTAAGVINLPVTLKDSTGFAFSRAFALNVGNSVSIITTSLASSPANLPYSDTLTAGGGVLTYKWSVVSGNLPPGLTLTTTANSTGVISGTPTTEGVFQFTVQVLDFAGGTATRAFTITIGPVLAITTTSLPDGALGGVQYSQALAAINGTTPYTWAIASGALPPGFQLNAATGVIAGVINATPSGTGTFTFDVQVTDAARNVAHRNLTIKIPLRILTGNLSAVVLTAFSQVLSATGGLEPYTWSSGVLPPGLQLNSVTGVISGTPTAGGNVPVVFTVTDARGVTGTATITFFIVQPPAPATTIGVGAATQPPVSLTTAAPYASEITGFITLRFTPATGVTGTDDMVRFSNGTRSLEYIVRPNTTTAIFPTSANPVIVPGTVAGTITLTASLSAGGQDITPSPAPTRTIVIDTAAPVITAVALQQVTGGISVVVTGYSNTREVSSGSFTFAVSTGNTLSQAQITVQLTSAFAAWFNGAASNATGGQFKLTVPFSVTGNATAINKVTVTLTNSRGTSGAVSSP